MNNRINRLHIPPFCITTFIILSVFTTISAEASDENKINSDTLTLGAAIREVVTTHPMVQQAEEALNAADTKIGLAKSGYYPVIDMSASYTRLGPVAIIPFNGMDFKLYPENNYSANLNFNQNIIDFGRTPKRVKIEKENKDISEQSMESVKQLLTMKTIGTFYFLLYLQEALKIKDNQLKILQEHLEYIKRKQETGSATNYEVLSTQVRMSGVESQKLDMEGSWETQSSVLNLLMGRPENTRNHLKEDIDTNSFLQSQDSLIAEALDKRSEMLIARDNERLAQIRIQMAKAEYNPSLHVFGSGGGKNGFPLNLNEMKLNYVAGVSLDVPLYNASRTKNNISLANSAFQTAQFETENTRRKIVAEVIDYYQKEKVSLKKIVQYQLQLEQAQKALDLAQTSFNTGSITNLDLLDASNSLAQSHLDLLKSRIEYLVNLYNLKIAIGMRFHE